MTLLLSQLKISLDHTSVSVLYVHSSVDRGRSLKDVTNFYLRRCEIYSSYFSRIKDIFLLLSFKGPTQCCLKWRDG